MPESNTVDLLGAQAINGDAKIDDHSPGWVEGSRVSHLKQPVSKCALGRYDTRNLLRRIVRISKGLLHIDHGLRKRGQIHGPGSQSIRDAAQELEGWEVCNGHVG